MSTLIKADPRFAGVRHNFPVYRDVVAFAPSEKMLRSDAIKIADSVYRSSDRLDREFRQTLVAGTRPKFVVAVENSSVRRDSGLTEEIDFAKYKISWRGFVAMMRFCTTFCGIKEAGGGKHKFWCRISLISVHGKPPINLGLSVLADFFSYAEEISNLTRERIWTTVAEIAAGEFSRLRYKKDGGLTIRFVDCDDFELNRYIHALVNMSDLQSFLEEHRGGNLLFADLVAIHEASKKIGRADSGILISHLENRNYDVFPYFDIVSDNSPSICIETWDGGGARRLISGIGYEDSQDPEKRLSFRAGQSLMYVEGSTI